MFTGLIEAICKVASVYRAADALMLTVDLGNLAEDCKIGDSIAINGVCLTIAKLYGNLASFDVSGETLTKTTLGKLQPAAQVNVERAMKPTERFGGHFVLGHIDGIASITQVDRNSDFADMKFSANTEVLGQMVLKGSVAVDGISLTIAGMDDNSFSIALIPETLKKTTLGTVKPGDFVNIETDVIVKTIKKQLENLLPQKETLTVEKLKQLGF